MHIDARAMPDIDQDCDLCIIGAGPAGISLAREFIGSPWRVVLLESGGMSYDRQAQALADGTSTGGIKPSIEVNRRQFGGNANVWCIDLAPGEKGLRHALFDEIDFQHRPWIGHSGWPLTREELMPYYQRAQEVCGGGPCDYSAAPWQEADAHALPLQGTGLETAVFHFTPFEIFTNRYRQQLMEAQNVAVYTYATATELLTDASGQRVEQVRVSGPGRKPWLMRARTVVLAAGGYENARLLLLSHRSNGIALGNDHQLVGRYYHDHLQGRSGYLMPAHDQVLRQLGLYDLRRRQGAYVMGYLKLSAQLQAQERVGNINCFLFPRPPERQDRAIEAFNTLRRYQLFRARAQEALPAPGLRNGLKHLWDLACGLDYVVKTVAKAATGQQSTAYGIGHGGWSRLERPGDLFSRVELWHSIEQTPRAENRVALGQRLDPLGRPQLEVHWHWPEEDVQQTLRAQALFARGLERAGLGRVERYFEKDGSPHLERPTGSHHLMGTTRMHADARKGVVDAQCRVHSTENLYVAGSSVFPTGGYANPTLTLVALALRLADHLKVAPAKPNLGGAAKTPEGVTEPHHRVSEATVVH